MTLSTARLNNLLSPRWGRLLGAAAGWLLGGWWGLLLGFAVGLLLDYSRLLWPFLDRHWPDDELEAAERRFRITLFAVMGHLAKADGRVSEAEVAAARTMMNELGLDEVERRCAIAVFTAGKRPGFPLPLLLGRLRQCCRRLEQRERFLAMQVRLAIADGEPEPAQLRGLRQICRGLALEPLRLEQFLRRHGRNNGGAGRGDLRRTLASAYAELGVDETATDAEIKRAYRRAISRHHPDRMVARGMAEPEVQAAAQRTHMIRAAYEEIRRVRNF